MAPAGPCLRPEAHLEPVTRVVGGPLAAGGVAGSVDAGVAALHAPAGAAGRETHWQMKCIEECRDACARLREVWSDDPIHADAARGQQQAVQRDRHVPVHPQAAVGCSLQAGRHPLQRRLHSDGQKHQVCLQLLAAGQGQLQRLRWAATATASIAGRLNPMALPLTLGTLCSCLPLLLLLPLPLLQLDASYLTSILQLYCPAAACR